jgi:hypothetical protein
LVTLELPADSPVAELPWIITVGPLDELDEWEPVVCGPYERPHALALARAVVADEELMAVVEPLLPRVSAEEILVEVAEARRGAGHVTADEETEAADTRIAAPTPPSAAEVRAGFARIAERLTGDR